MTASRRDARLHAIVKNGVNNVAHPKNDNPIFLFIFFCSPIFKFNYHILNNLIIKSQNYNSKKTAKISI
ncbi:Uncharacterised protein [Mycoplasma putrefaciens]|nr:Uncharacterised protein [Mycoplasma putrefaciens]